MHDEYLVRRTPTLPAVVAVSGILEQCGVLTIHEDYFLLTGGLERWLYRGAKARWEAADGLAVHDAPTVSNDPRAEQEWLNALLAHEGAADRFLDE
jgi:hypothetical protein